MFNFFFFCLNKTRKQQNNKEWKNAARGYGRWCVKNQNLDTMAEWLKNNVPCLKNNSQLTEKIRQTYLDAPGYDFLFIGQGKTGKTKT